MRAQLRTPPHRIVSVGAMLLTLACAAPQDQASTVNPVQGAWIVSEIRSATDSSTNSQPGPGMMIFSATHYSQMFSPDVAPRALPATAWAPTEAERAAAYDSFIANTGTYEVSGSTITFHTMLAKSTEFTGGQMVADFQVNGDMMTFTIRELHGPDGKGPPNAFDTMTLRRAE